MAVGGVLGKLFGEASGGIIKSIGETVDRFVTTDAEKLALNNEMAKIILQHMQTIESSVQVEMEAKAAVMQAEMQSGDSYTKRARPTVVYFGLVAIGLNYVVGPWLAYLVGVTPPTIELPEQFWMTWGGVCAVWFIGRSAERRGAQNQVIKMITGTNNVE